MPHFRSDVLWAWNIASTVARADNASLINFSVSLQNTSVLSTWSAPPHLLVLTGARISFASSYRVLFAMAYCNHTRDNKASVFLCVCDYFYYRLPVFVKNRRKKPRARRAV